MASSVNELKMLQFPVITVRCCSWQHFLSIFVCHLLGETEKQNLHIRNENKTQLTRFQPIYTIKFASKTGRTA